MHVCAHMCCLMGPRQRKAWGPKWTPPPPSIDALSLLGLVKPVTVPPLQALDGHLTVFILTLGESSKTPKEGKAFSSGRWNAKIQQDKEHAQDWGP